ncbi:hypothetical protein CAEBREN_31969 [Caenorhabditis brenneri]|uniref:Uncharacterized protein n=1 Tax=Caenorhabditis brenneri TaxID=135651 RepID=G0MEY2_CAEBE|nr:hypothetical protein CAEBREN_31969 [Caenorhabditis brenneri]
MGAPPPPPQHLTGGRANCEGGGIASTNANNGMVGGLSRESRAPSRTSRKGSSRSQTKQPPIDPDEPSTSNTAERRPSTHFMLDIPVVSNRCKYFTF